MAIDKFDFEFEFADLNKGKFAVAYISPQTGKRYFGNVYDAELVDNVINNDAPSIKSLNELKKKVKESYMKNDFN